MALVTDNVIAAVVVTSGSVIAVLIPTYLKNKRSIRRVSAEQYIEEFMKRELESKNIIIAAMEETIKSYQSKLQLLEVSNFKKDAIIKDLRALTRELKAELAAAKRQAKRWQEQINKFHEGE